MQGVTAAIKDQTLLTLRFRIHCEITKAAMAAGTKIIADEETAAAPHDTSSKKIHHFAFSNSRCKYKNAKNSEAMIILAARAFPS